MKQIFLVFFSLYFIACNSNNLKIEESNFGNTPEGEAKLFTISNANGMSLSVTNYGGIVTSLLVPDKNGKLDDLVQGFDKIEDYIEDGSYQGALIGRYANRIGEAKFAIDGNTYELEKNNGPNSLHGGINAFNKKLWTVEIIEDEETLGVELMGISPDGEEGFPGNLKIWVRYLLTEDNEFIIEYDAETDKATPVNLTNHCYWNLKGAGNGDILDHELMINGEFYTPVDSNLIPTGRFESVLESPFDFTEAMLIGERISDEHPQLAYGNGYDHNFVLTEEKDELVLAAMVHEESSGRVMTVMTTKPGIQLYTGNFLDGSKGKEGKAYHKHGAFCLETQHYPDTPNKPQFPSCILHKGEKYETTTIYAFSTIE